MKKIALLGSTGSIGESTLEVIRHLRSHCNYEIDVTALAVHSNIKRLKEQIQEFTPKVVAVYDLDAAQQLQDEVSNVTVLKGAEGLVEIAEYAEINHVVSAISGTRGLEPTFHAIKAGKDISLANKESLVSAGALITETIKQKNVSLFPIDSEHSALAQCLNGENSKTIHCLTLTASGGPFKNHSKEQLEHITPKDALNHPTWEMGAKITIDSSTLMNKGFEVIEAYWLFPVKPDQINVVIHPQSVVHSMIEYQDGSIIAQMSEPNMMIPIQYALTFPEREQGILPKFDWTKQRSLDFHAPDLSRFPCLSLAFQAIQKGGTLPCYLNAANEVLVYRFLNGEIEWKEIGEFLELLMAKHQIEEADCLQKILKVNANARKDAQSIKTLTLTKKIHETIY